MRAKYSSTLCSMRPQSDESRERRSYQPVCPPSSEIVRRWFAHPHCGASTGRAACIGHKPATHALSARRKTGNGSPNLGAAWICKTLRKLQCPNVCRRSAGFPQGQHDICADEGNPVPAIIPVADADDPRRDGVPFPVCQRHVNRQQILGAPSPLLARLKNLLDVHSPAVRLVEYLGSLLDHGDGVQLAFPADTEDGFRRSKPSVEQHICGPMTSPKFGFQHLCHDIRTLLVTCFRRFPTKERMFTSHLGPIIFFSSPEARSRPAIVRKLFSSD